MLTHTFLEPTGVPNKTLSPLNWTCSRLNRVPNNTQQHLTHSSGITALLSPLFLQPPYTHCSSQHQHVFTALTLRFSSFLLIVLFFPFRLPPLSRVHAPRESKRDSCFASYCTYTHTHTSSNTDCRLIKGTTHLLSTHRDSRLNRLPGKLDTSKTITGLRLFLSNV